MTSVAIIIVNWNGKQNTLDCLVSLGKLKAQSSKLKVIVVDNGSTDNSVKVIREKFPDVEVIETGKNLGFADGNNVGIRHALRWGAHYIWILNNDTVVDKSALVALFEAFGDKSVGMVGSKIYFLSGHEFHKDRYRKEDRGHVLWYAGGLIDWQNMYASHRGVDEVDTGQYDTTMETPFITGCSMMVKREVFGKIGLLDEKLFAYLEDLDLCLRAKQAGYKLFYAPQSIVWHKNAGSSGVGSETHQYYMTRNRLLVGMRFASLRTKSALIREAMWFVLKGTSIYKKAVIDAMLGKWGKA